MATVNYLTVAGNVIFEADVPSSDNSWFHFVREFSGSMPEYLRKEIACCNEYQVEEGFPKPSRELTDEETKLIEDYLYS